MTKQQLFTLKATFIGLKWTSDGLQVWIIIVMWKYLCIMWSNDQCYRHSRMYCLLVAASKFIFSFFLKQNKLLSVIINQQGALWPIALRYWHTTLMPCYLGWSLNAAVILLDQTGMTTELMKWCTSLRCHGMGPRNSNSLFWILYGCRSKLYIY